MAITALPRAPCVVARATVPPRRSPTKNTAAPAPFVQPSLDMHSNVTSQRMSAVALAAVQEDASKEAVLSEEKLVQLTKEFLAAGFGGYDRPDLFADDMVFRGPEIGPLRKDMYLQVVENFKANQAFPDMETKGFGFSIDPTDPNRVWFFSQTTGTHKGDFDFFGNIFPATGEIIRNGTEANSIIWNPDGKIKYLSVGYCVDRINSNTPNGTMKVKSFGFMRTVGGAGFVDLLSNPVVRWVSNVVLAVKGQPRNDGKDVPLEELPEWWQKIPDADLRGSDNYHK